VSISLYARIRPSARCDGRQSILYVINTYPVLRLTHELPGVEEIWGMRRSNKGNGKDGRWAPVSDIFDKIKKTIGVGVDTVGAKSKELWDTTVVRARISDLRAKRRDLLEDLGGLTFEMLSGGSLAEPVLRAKADAIREIDRQIAADEEEIRRIREASREHQQADEVPVQPVEADRPESAGDTTAGDGEPSVREEPKSARTCECGTAVLEGARFCVACGRPVSQD
jgi:hypothetical protein